MSSAIIRLTTKEKTKHILVWVIITIFLCVVDPPPQIGFLLSAVAVLLTMLGYMIVYYSHYLFIFPRYYYQNSKIAVLLSIVIFIIFQFMNYINIYYIMTLSGIESYFSGTKVYDLALIISLFFFIILIMAIADFKNKISIEKIKIQNELEKILITKELGFFKNQFNSHITFNFLNYCYSHLHTKSKEAAEAIELFSDLLRYTLNNKPDEAVPLKNEATHIGDFISLQKQLNKEIYAQFQIIGELEGHYILPRILITIVENAFKHGESQVVENPICIILEAKKNLIALSVTNKKKLKDRPLISTGIGYSNIKKFLDLFYKDNYQLNVDNDDNSYSCQLLINN